MSVVKTYRECEGFASGGKKSCKVDMMNELCWGVPLQMQRGLGCWCVVNVKWQSAEEYHTFPQQVGSDGSTKGEKERETSE